MPVVEIRAEYDCGHNSRTIAAGDVSVLNVPHGLRMMMRKASTGGAVRFNCRCGRAATFVHVRVDGNLVQRVPAEKFLGIKTKE